jgi:sensor c-di-GMP phosphodiesterase-like protein
MSWLAVERQARVGREARQVERIHAVLDEPSLLRIVYQPIVDLANNRLAGVEALARFDTRTGRPTSVAEVAAAGLTLELELAAIRAAADLNRILRPATC